MKINYLDINIIDTTENTTVLSVEKTGLSAPKLIYNGAEDKFSNIITSEFNFNFLVTDGEEGKFFDLFTGSETRYKVEVVDSSTVGFPKVLWCGYLLAEQFLEPYKNDTFFVDFVATDGVALLKEKDVSVVFGDYSVLDVINRCLSATGLNLPILFSEAIQNAAFNLDYLDLIVDGSCYVDIEAAYDVLLHCLKGIGCCLFQINYAWHIIGLNKLKEPELVLKKYTINSGLTLDYVGVVNYNREVVTDSFIASPSVTIIPPLKKVSVVWQHEGEEFLIPEDVVSHWPVNIGSDVNDRTPKYWQTVTNAGCEFKVWLLLVNYDNITLWDFNSYYQGEKATPNLSLEDNLSGPYMYFNIPAAPILLADLATNYATLEDPFFIYGSENLERYATLTIDFIAYPFNYASDLDTYFGLKNTDAAIVNNGANVARINSTAHGLTSGDVVQVSALDYYAGYHKVTVVDNDKFDLELAFSGEASCAWVIAPFKSNFRFAVTRKDHLTDLEENAEVYFSNFDGSNLYDFIITQSNGGIKGQLTIEKIALTADGYYNLRLYPVATHSLLSGLVVYTKTEFTLQLEAEEDFVQKRDIDYTTSHSVELFHAASRSKLSNRTFTFSESLPVSSSGDVGGGLFLVEPKSYSLENIVYLGISSVNVVVVLSPLDYYRIYLGYEVFVVKEGGSVMQQVVDADFILGDNFSITQSTTSSVPNILIEETDTVYVKLPSGSTELIYSDYFLDKWKRYDVSESANMYEVLNSMYHDLLFEYNFKVTGTILALVGPLDIVSFSFRGKRNFYPTMLELDLTAGKTNLTMIETKNAEVTDYE